MKRKTRKKLRGKVKILLKKRGQESFEFAKKTILQEKIGYKPVHEALRFFMEEAWYDVQHPALLSLTCEAAGGNPDKTTRIGAAMVLMTGAADIHDDIIDKSEIKGSKLTVLGKFGKDIALLVGDALLFEGLTLLHESCESLPKKQKQIIINLTKQAFFEIGNAEAKEISFKGKKDLAPEEYRNIIEMKAAVAEANARIGAVLGGGTLEEIDALGRYGRILGVLMTIRDEFIDTFEPDELRNRAENECLPLPILCAFKNDKTKSKLLCLLKKRKLNENDAYRVVEIISNTKEVQQLKKQMRLLIRNGIESLQFGKVRRMKKELRQLLLSTIDDL